MLSKWINITTEPHFNILLIHIALFGLLMMLIAHNIMRIVVVIVICYKKFGLNSNKCSSSSAMIILGKGSKLSPYKIGQSRPQNDEDHMIILEQSITVSVRSGFSFKIDSNRYNVGVRKSLITPLPIMINKGTMYSIGNYPIQKTITNQEFWFSPNSCHTLTKGSIICNGLTSFKLRDDTIITVIT